MKNQFIAQMEAMFGGDLPAVVSDSGSAACWAEELGLAHVPMGAAFKDPPASAIIVCTSDSWYARVSELRDVFDRSRALWLPLVAFDGGDAAVRYGLDQLARTDFGAIPDSHDLAINLLAGSARSVITDARGTDLTVSFGGQIGFATITGVEVPSGDFTSLLSFFEVEAEFPDASDRPPVTINGVLRPNGILAAHGPYGLIADDPRLEAGRILPTSWEARPVVEIVDSSITKIEAGGVDLADTFQWLAGHECGLRLTEFAVGVNDLAAETIRWDINSPLNEGVQGIHVGIGDGRTGIHIDFVCAGVSLAHENSKM